MFQELYSKGRATIVPTIARATRGLTSTFNNVLGARGTLQARAPQRAHCEPPKRRARGVAFVIGISLSIPMQAADGGSIDAIQPKQYIRIHYSHKQALCLIKLYGKESAFNPRAIGNEDGIRKAYGIPQLKNPIIKDLSANKQIDYGIKYIDHRYQGKPCLAWKHSQRKGWY